MRLALALSALGALATLASPRHGGAQAPSESAGGVVGPPADSAYLAALRPVMRGDTAVDLTMLRRLYARTSFYAPYDVTRDQQRQRMWAALNTAGPRAAVPVADSVLAANYLDLDAHLASGVAARERGDSAAAELHFALVRGLLRSIESTGDGRTRERPLFVLSPAEEYSYLAARGLRRTGMQGLSDCAGRECDAMTVAERDGGESFQLYFDVSLATGHLRRRFEAAEKAAAGSDQPAAGAKKP